MRHTIWLDTTRLGTVDLPAGQFVATRLQPTPSYQSIAESVQRATHAFLRLGLFYASIPEVALSPEDAAALAMILSASHLRLSLADSGGRVVATHFINLLQPRPDDGIIVLVSRSDGPALRRMDPLPRDPDAATFVAPAV